MVRVREVGWGWGRALKSLSVLRLSRRSSDPEELSCFSGGYLTMKTISPKVAWLYSVHLFLCFILFCSAGGDSTHCCHPDYIEWLQSAPLMPQLPLGNSPQSPSRQLMWLSSGDAWAQRSSPFSGRPLLCGFAGQIKCRGPTTDQWNNSTQVELSEPMSLLRLLI